MEIRGERKMPRLYNMTITSPVVKSWDRMILVINDGAHSRYNVWMVAIVNDFVRGNR